MRLIGKRQILKAFVNGEKVKCTSEKLTEILQMNIDGHVYNSDNKGLTSESFFEVVNNPQFRFEIYKEKKVYKLYYHYYVNHCNNICVIDTHLEWSEWSKGNIYTKEKCKFVKTEIKEIESEDKN